MSTFRIKTITNDTRVIFDYVEIARDAAEALHAVATRRLGMSPYTVLKVRS